MKISMLN